MRYYPKRPKPRQAIQPSSTAVRRYDDGREVCLANEEGRAEYTRRKQLVWERQLGICALHHCGRRMSLQECRLTGGDWELTGQLRDDRIEEYKYGKPANQLVHKDCLRKWHEHNRMDREIAGDIDDDQYPVPEVEAQAPATSTAALSGQVMTQYGTPAASSMVRICPITSGGIPCFPSAQLYSDYLLTQPVDNPLTTDQFGNYKAFLANGIYAIQISLAGSNAPTFIYFASVGWGGGTVFSVSGLAPLFIAVNPTTSPTFQLLPAGAHQFFGNSSGSSGTPGYVQPSFTDLLGTASASQLVLAVLLNPSTTQTITEPSGNSFNFITSGGGKLNYNGSEVITALNLPSNLILSNPVGPQTITQPAN